MVQPNEASIGFTNWLLNISKQHLSGPQRIIVQAVYDAAIGNYTISDQTWYNFNLFTAWRNPYYLVFRDYAFISNPSLNVGIISAWDFEGNSNSSDSAYDGTDLNISYSLTYGKILQGASLLGSLSSISHLPINTTSTFSINIWCYIQPGTSNTTIIWHNGSTAFGLFYNVPTGIFTYYGSNTISATTSVSLNNWAMVTITADGVGSNIYINGSDASASNPVLSNAPLAQFGYNNATFNLLGFLDAPTIWNRKLNSTEVLALYNSGNGLQYPF